MLFLFNLIPDFSKQLKYFFLLASKKKVIIVSFPLRFVRQLSFDCRSYARLMRIKRLVALLDLMTAGEHTLLFESEFFFRVDRSLKHRCRLFFSSHRDDKRHAQG